MVDTIRGRHDDQPGQAPTYTGRVQGAGFSPSKVVTVGSCAELRSQIVAHGDTVYVLNQGYFHWESSVVVDDGTEGTAAVAVTGDTSGNRYVRTNDGVALAQTPLAAASGVNTLWSYAVPASTDVRAVVDANFSAASGDRWIGSLACTAKRIGSGALAVTGQAMGAALELTDSAWAPAWVAVGNTLSLQVTGDTSYQIVPRGVVRYQTTDTSGDPSISALAAARAAVLGDAPELLFYADVGTTPSSPSIGDNVTAWADQSGTGLSLTAIAGREPHYGLDGTWPYLQLTDALDVATDEIVCVTTGTRVFRFTLDSTAAGTFGILFYRENEAIAIHTGAGFNQDGSNIMVAVNASWISVGAMQNGKHCYELRLNSTAQTVTLYIDGTIVGSPVAMGAFNAPGGLLRLGFGSTGYATIGNLYGFTVQDGAGTDAQMNRWITMSELAWGEND